MPMMRLALAFIPGISAGVLGFVPSVQWMWAGMGIGGLGCLLFTRKKVPYQLRHIYALCCLVCWFGVGTYSGHKYLSIHQKDYFGNLHVEDPVWTGCVREVSKKEFPRCILEVEGYWDQTNSFVPARGKLLVYPGKGSKLETGQIVQFRARLSEIPPPQNPGAFDNKRYRFFQNIHHQSYWKEGDYQVVGQRPLPALERWRMRQIAMWKELLQDPSEFSIASAMVLGYKDELPEEIRTTYAQTGASHVLAVSGLHVGLIYLILNFFLSRLRWRFLKILLSLAGIWGFAMLTGATPSVLRASTMFSFVMIGKQMRRPISIYNSLAASAFLLLWINPLWLFHIGFQLSYLAVLGIVVFQPLWYQLWIPSGNWPDKIWSLITVSLAAQLATLPLTLYYFHQFPVYFWLSGLIVVPAAPFIIALGILLILFSNWLPAWEWIPATLLGELISWINRLLEAIQALPGSVVSDIYLPGAGVALSMASLFLLAWIWENKDRQKVHWLLILWIAVAMSRCIAETRAFCMPRMVVYHVYGHTLADLVYRGQLITIKDKEISEDKEVRAAGTFRKMHRSYRKDIRLLDEEYILLSTREGEHPEYVVVGGKSARKQAKAWEELCQHKGWAFVNVRTSGYFIQTFSARDWPFLWQLHPPEISPGVD